MEWRPLVLFCFIGGSLAAEPTLRPGLGSVEKSQNDSYVVFCSSPGEDVTWTSPKGRIIDAPSGRLHVEQKNDIGLALMFDRIEASDRGRYTCTSTSKGIVSFDLSVVRKPKFVNTPTVHPVNEYQNTIIKCEVDGEPKPAITWQRNGLSVDSSMSGKYLPESKGLKIVNASKADAGVFTCRALQVGRDDGFIASVDIILKVQHKPEWRGGSGAAGPVSAYGYVGGETNLTCEALAEPPANYTWYRNNKEIRHHKINASEIKESDRSVLQIFIPDESLYGQYQCKAKNNLGVITRVFDLQKGEKPPPPSGMRMVSTGVHDARLKLASELKPYELLGYRAQFVISRPGQDVVWDHPDVQDLALNGEGYYEMKDLLENTPYTVRVATRSAAGLSDYSEETVALRTRKQGDLVGSSSVISPSLCMLATLLSYKVAAVISSIH